jgi:acetyltransferase-like isoleucine patch superfamily enzyme
MSRLWQSSLAAGWLRTVAGLLRGVKIHPRAAVIGRRGQVQLAHSVSVGAGCVLRADAGGQVRLEQGVWLARDVEIDTATRVSIGARTTVQRRCTVNGTTRIGADCILAPDIFISSGTHPFRQLAHLTIREQERRLAAEGVDLDRPVWIQDDCWLGTHVVVAPGVTIGKGCVVGANSVVTRDVAPYSVVAGSPARVIGQRLDWRPPARVDARADTDLPYILSGVCEPQGVRPTPDAPVVVALASGRGIRIGLLCSAPVRLQVNGRPHDFAPGQTELLVDGDALRINSLPGAADGHPAPVFFTSFERMEPA